MPEIPAGAVYELLLFGTVIGEETINRFFYFTTNDGATADQLGLAFISDIIPAMQLIISNLAGYSLVQVNGVRDHTDFATLAVDAVGLNSGDCLPPYACWDYTFVRGAVGERNGYKRIAGIPESEQSDGIVTSGSAPSVTALALLLGGDITVDTFNFTPCIRRTRIHKVPQIPPKYYSISACRYSKIGTQNSRKFGHGR